jgi:hypothetical protein
MRRDFGCCPFVLHAEIQNCSLQPGHWCERYPLAGSVPRAQKELVAEAISEGNECLPISPRCMTYTILLRYVSNT